jgi:hypothetical protein
MKDVKTITSGKGKEVLILSVNKTSGERIEFLKRRPGRIYKDSIIGAVRKLREEIEIDRANIKDILRDEKGRILGITKIDGKIYHVFKEVTDEHGTYRVFTGKAKEIEDKLILSKKYFEVVSIPLSEVNLVLVRKPAPFKRISIVLGVLGAAFLVLMAIVAAKYTG